MNELKMSRIEQINGEVFQVRVMWERVFVKEILVNHPEFYTSLLQHSPLVSRVAIYGGRTVDLKFHYKLKEGETIQYDDVMSLFP